MKKRYLFLTLSLVLCGCNNHNSSYDYSITPIEEKDLVVADVYEAIEKLISLNNYTLSITLKDDNEVIEYDNIYAEKYYYSNYPNDEKGFIEDENGVYRVNMYEKHLISSELYVDENNKPYTNLYNSRVFASFKNISLEKFTSAKKQTAFEVSTKNERLLILDILEVPQKYYTDIISCSFSLKGTNVNSLYLSLELNEKMRFEGVFNSFGQSIASEVIDFKAQKKTYTKIHSDLLKAKELFALNNYKRVCYRDEDPNKQVIGYEWFHPNYWFGDFIKENLTSDEMILMGSERGYLGLEKKIKDGEKYDGAYIFYLDENYSNCNLILTYPAFTTNISSLIDIMNYPSKMEMWNYNLQFFEYVPDQTEYPGKNLFVTSDPLIISNWLDNFQINLSLEDGLVAYMYDLRIITDIYDNPKDSNVIFQFDYILDGTVYGLQREFIDFNNSNIPEMDTIYNSFSNQ